MNGGGEEFSFVEILHGTFNCVLFNCTGMSVAVFVRVCVFGFGVWVDGCEVRPCDPCARVRPCVPCVPCVSRLPPVSFYRYELIPVYTTCFVERRCGRSAM